LDKTSISALGDERSALVKEKQRAALLSVLAGFVLTVVKIIVGVMTGSLGILAEAAHSGLDFGAAAVTFFAVRSSWRPPDAEHHYGHAKIENLSALAETALLLATSVWIISEAIERFMGKGPEVEPNIWAFVVMGGSIIIDFGRSRDLGRVARKSNSQALEADALHFSTDIASSAVVLVGLGCVLAARAHGIPWLRYADPIAATVVALIVLVLSWNLGKRASDMLLDRAPAGLTDKVMATLREIAGIEGEPVLRLRQGGDQFFAEVELPLSRGLPLAQGDLVAAEARERIAKTLGRITQVTVQLKGDASAATWRDRVATAVAMEGIMAHNISIRREGSQIQADLHIEVPRAITLGQGHAVADRVERRLRQELSELSRIDIHLELHESDPAPAGEIDPPTRHALEARILEVSRRVVGERAVHDVLLSRTPAGIFLSCHCYLATDMPMAEAHAATERLEAELKVAIPELHRVAVHAEPDGLPG
jgi:cation diffusion facilitator family transporter